MNLDRRIEKERTMLVATVKEIREKCGYINDSCLKWATLQRIADPLPFCKVT